MYKPLEETTSRYKKYGIAIGVLLLIVLTVVLVVVLSESSSCNSATTGKVRDDAVDFGEFGALYEWEDNTVVEPAVVTAFNQTYLFYRGGWHVPFIGRAIKTCTSFERSSTPLFFGAQPWATVINDTIHLYYTDTLSSKTMLAVTADGENWSHTDLQLPEPERSEGWGNRALYKNVLYQEAIVWRGDTRLWDIFMYRYDSGRYVLVGNLPLPKPHGCGMIGGINFEDMGTYTIAYYHAGYKGGNLPTAIYSAISTNMVKWTNLTRRVPTPSKHDQSADPFKFGNDLYYDIDNNVEERASIRYAKLFD